MLDTIDTFIFDRYQNSPIFYDTGAEVVIGSANAKCAHESPPRIISSYLWLKVCHGVSIRVVQRQEGSVKLPAEVLSSSFTAFG